ncbi:TIGR03943 family putative permease subunit [Bifidobacterium psychraerophilum]|uniref:TIGR03943 family putative permease subunit n=1 Tax=Bifidobacterium psychraerophilum TaxID=218140 RepID=UPI0023F18D4E|nr:TIGR03943 family protein [Bifidobacterium psychraerophilum]MCI1660468.1 TIGR03943 family protein [Bifidobacterium psychraerophilum]MCI1805122.1 TIGR03943 family protein [Bifidobacterium psychraerophilum]MCI2175583.1 TIGR03943 family protein [Bifidobacterium psychraerophilum]MCI2182077.1 TIGR03943 family protein [Bifidobacterium psychraerophilum]
MSAVAVSPSRVRSRPTLLNRMEGCCLLLLAASMAILIATGRYLSFVTPRSLPYIMFAIVVLAVLGIASWLGWITADKRTLRSCFALLVVPALLFLLPVSSSQSLNAFAGSRAIAIQTSQSSTKLPGLDAGNRRITISDDDFGFWYNQIDKHAEEYIGYTVVLSAQVSTNSALGNGQFTASRMLMTCCVLDMTAFGFTVDASDGTIPKTDSWVQVTGTLERGRIGSASQGYEGLVLKASSVGGADSATGYFYYA